MREAGCARVLGRGSASTSWAGREELGRLGQMGVEMVFPIFDLLYKRGNRRDLSEIQLDTETNSEEYIYIYIYIYMRDSRRGLKGFKRGTKEVGEITKDWKGVATHSRWIYQWRFRIRSKRERV